VTSRAADLPHLKQQRIVIAIDEGGFYFLKMTGLFALEPETLS